MIATRQVQFGLYDSVIAVVENRRIGGEICISLVRVADLSHVHAVAIHRSDLGFALHKDWLAVVYGDKIRVSRLRDEGYEIVEEVEVEIERKGADSAFVSFIEDDMLLVLDWAGELELWRLSNSECLARRQTAELSPQHCKVSRDGRIFIFNNAEGRFFAYKTENLRQIPLDERLNSTLPFAIADKLLYAPDRSKRV